MEVDRIENRITFNQTRSSELSGRNEQITLEGNALAGQHAEWETRNSAQLQAVENARRDSITVRAGVERLTAQATHRAAEISEAEARLDALGRVATQAGESLLRLHGEQKQAEEALVRQTGSMRKQEEREATLLESSIKVRDDADRAAQDWQSAVTHAGELQKNATQTQVRISELKAAREKAQKEADVLRDGLSTVRARHSTLTQILNDRSYTGEAVQKLFAANERQGGQEFRAVGVLADYAEVQEQHEAAVEQYLREELEYVVVETYDHARAGVSLLRNEVGGRATFFVDSLRNLKLDEYEPIVHFRSEDGVISRLDKLVEFRDPLGPAAKQFLPRLRSGYLTDSAVTAEKLAREYPQYAFVTTEGTCYQGRMVTGGRPDEAGPLGMKRELRALDAEVMALEARMNEIQDELERTATEIRETEISLETVTAKHHEAERDVISASHHYQHTQAELARLGLELTVCQNDLARLRLDVADARQRAERAIAEHETAGMNGAQAEAERVRLPESLIELRSSVQA